MDLGEVRTRYRDCGVSYSKDRQAERMRAYQEALESVALAKNEYETVRMQATVKAFVEGSKARADIKKYMSDEARDIAMQERAEKVRLKNEHEQRICLAAVGMAVASVLLTAYLMIAHH